MMHILQKAKKAHLLSLLYLLLFPLAAMGQNETSNKSDPWVLISEHPKNAYLTYMNPSSIQTDASQEHFKRVDILLEEKEGSKKQQTTTSIVVVTTINCHDQTGRVDELQFYAQNKALGEPVHINPATSKDFFSYNLKDESDIKLLTLVCKK